MQIELVDLYNFVTLLISCLLPIKTDAGITSLNLNLWNVKNGSDIRSTDFSTKKKKFSPKKFFKVEYTEELP